MRSKRFAICAAVIMAGLILLSSSSTLLINTSASNEPIAQYSSQESQSVKYVEVNNVTLGYREYGSGEPLLLICGFGATMDMWNSTFVSLLAAHYRVFTYDHRGMGYSEDDNETHTIALYASDAVGLMHELGFQSMNTYGTSMGASVSQQLVIDHPEAVRKMVLSSATYSIRIPECAMLLSIIESVSTNESIPLGIREEATANLDWNGSWSGLAGINKSIMLIVGTSDYLTPDSVSVQMAGQINGSWLVRLSGILHSGQSYAPVEYANSVIHFLETNEDPHFVPILPLAPERLIAVPGRGQIELSWDAPMSDGGSRITEYGIYRGSQLIATLNSTTLSYVDNDLEGGTVYTYYVVAVNEVGASEISSPVSAMPTEQSSDHILLLAGICGIVALVAAILIVRSRK